MAGGDLFWIMRAVLVGPDQGDLRTPRRQVRYDGYIALRQLCGVMHQQGYPSARWQRLGEGGQELVNLGTQDVSSLNHEMADARQCMLPSRNIRRGYAFANPTLRLRAHRRTYCRLQSINPCEYLLRRQGPGQMALQFGSEIRSILCITQQAGKHLLDIGRPSYKRALMCSPWPQTLPRRPR